MCVSLSVFGKDLILRVEKEVGVEMCFLIE
ncbi:hypothetical protein MFUL124B02_08730 [Myxococcus fulvus 124B02]|nr:hypothetical protein MFUL124B02_08730 [Myxococcus fulvus 124B02]